MMCFMQHGMKDDKTKSIEGKRTQSGKKISV